MSDGYNQAILLGNLGADPELRFTGSGEPVLNMRLATSRSWVKEGETERQERTEWHNVVIFGKRAEGLAKLLTKGDRIHVTGEIRYSEYDKDGVTMRRTDINAQTIVLCGKRGGEAPAAGQGRAPSAQPAARKAAGSGAARRPAPTAKSAPDASGDDIPY